MSIVWHGIVTKQVRGREPVSHSVEVGPSFSEVQLLLLAYKYIWPTVRWIKLKLNTILLS